MSPPAEVRPTQPDPAAAGDQSLTTAMAAILDRIPETLVDTSARRSVLRVAAALPSSLTQGPLGLELRLAGPTRVDVFAAATPRTTSFQGLLACLSPRSSGDQPQGSAWADPQRADDLATVLRQWQAGTGAINAVARYLLVEADAPPDPESQLAVPSIFLAPRAPRDIFRPGQPPNAFHRHVEATVLAAAELSGVWPDPATAEQLAAVVQVLADSSTDGGPGDGDIFAVGAMVSRAAGASLRIALRRLTVDQMQQILHVLQRPRQADILAAWVSTTVAQRWVLACDVGPGAESRVGVELATAHDWQRADPTGWPELCAEVVAHGVALPERTAAGVSLIDRHSNPLWGLAHIKVAADEHGVLPVGKLYVGLRHQPIDMGEG